MKYLIPSICLLGSLLWGQNGLDPRYHTLQEIYAELDSLESVPEYQDIFRVDTIGYSQQDNLPLVAAVISDQVQQEEDEPRVLFVGQVHAEEILGVEAVLKLLEDLLNPEPSQVMHAAILRQNLEIWIVPTANPEGLNVVYDGLDYSYRKNKHDFSPDGPWPNGIFDYDPAIGNDVDGVDLNRNFDFNWIFGDGFLELDGSSYGAHYDYYRGPAPFSESETRALRDLALEKHFVFSIIFHSSRSGNFSEKVFTSWRWGGVKESPDFPIMKSIGDELASRIIKENGSGTYLSKVSTSRNGKAHDWFYKETGCFQYLIECGTANLQPDSALIEDTALRLQPPLYYLMDRAIGYQENAAQITGIVYRADQPTVPLEGVEVDLLEHRGGVLTPRTTDGFGRYRRIVTAGSYQVRFRKDGFAPQQFLVTANNSAITTLDVYLTPLPEYTVDLELQPDPEFVVTAFPTVILKNEFSADTFETSFGGTEIPLTEGRWTLTVLDSGAKPWQEELNLQRDTTVNVFIDAPDFMHTYTFFTPSSWTTWSGSWVAHFDTLLSQSSWLYPNQDTTGTRYEIISRARSVAGAQSLTLILHHRYELEWDRDSIAVILEDAGGHPLGSRVWKGQNWTYHDDYLMVRDSAGFDSVRVHLLFSRDETVNYRGWNIADMTLMTGTDPFLGLEESGRSRTSPPRIRMSALYPNPTGGMLAFVVDGPAGTVTLRLYNLLGQELYSDVYRFLSPGRHPVRLNLSTLASGPLSSGVYFITLTTPNRSLMRKCLYLKN
ncbi:MAG: T9SS C-terminal target domain-containing protein [Candidatus Neomarinimicrobiota bacterium]|nr:MAG: T9SS C-terminal target domain-containing protein [Candidatus Neomarinimicrobiota bacterium]